MHPFSFTGIELSREHFRREGDFSVEMGPDVLVLFKKDQKLDLKKKQVFSTESKEQH